MLKNICCVPDEKVSQEHVFIVYFFMYASFREETKKAANAALRYEAFNSFFQKVSMLAFN